MVLRRRMEHTLTKLKDFFAGAKSNMRNEHCVRRINIAEWLETYWFLKKYTYVKDLKKFHKAIYDCWKNYYVVIKY